MFAVQFGININNFYFGGAGAAPPAGPAQAAPVQASAQLPSQLPAASFEAAAGQSLAQFTNGGQLPSSLQRAGFGVGQPDVAHATSNPTSAAGAASPGAQPALTNNAQGAFAQGGFDLGAFASGGFASGGFLVGTPVVLVPVFLQAPGGGFAVGPAPALPQPPQETIDPIVPQSVTDADVEPVVTAPAAPAVELTPNQPTAPPAGPAVVQVPAADFDSALRSGSRTSVDTELSLSLRTIDGDEITLEFRQIDLATRLGDDSADSTERLVDISINGELDDAERAALDDVISSVIDVAQRFLSGDLQGTRQAAADLDFDTSELAELSLKLSVTRSATVDAAYGGDLTSLRSSAERSPAALEVFEVFASEQRSLIASARETLADASAVTLVGELLPALLTQPLEQLSGRVTELPPVELQPEPEPEPES